MELCLSTYVFIYYLMAWGKKQKSHKEHYLIKLIKVDLALLALLVKAEQRPQTPSYPHSPSSTTLCSLIVGGTTIQVSRLNISSPESIPCPLSTWDNCEALLRFWSWETRLKHGCVLEGNGPGGALPLKDGWNT